jgi:hypothetical protein
MMIGIFDEGDARFEVFFVYLQMFLDWIPFDI